MSHEVERVAVIGAGLMGGSLALACRAAGVTSVAVTDASSSVRTRARELELADVVAETVAEAVRGADLVVAAVPTPAVPLVLEEASRYAASTSILTDIASLKSSLTLEVESRLRERDARPERYVGGHPMAGSERSGPEAADARLYQAATWILTPTALTDDHAIRRLSGFLGRLGARVLALPPERHDQLVAIVSHLPHIAACALADVAADSVATSGEAVMAVAGGGFRDTTRIAAGDPDLWLGILQGNRDAALEALTTYQDRLERLRAALASGDEAGVREILVRASEARRRLVPKEVAVELADLVVAVVDRPGQLAEVATALGEAGLNIEDIAMRHAADGGRGSLLVRVAAADGRRAVEVLDARGVHAHLEPASVDAVGVGGADRTGAATTQEGGSAPATDDAGSHENR